MMFLLNLHRDQPSLGRFTEVLDALDALEIPDKEVDWIGTQFLYAAMLPATCYGHSPQYIEEILNNIGIEVHWI